MHVKTKSLLKKNQNQNNTRNDIYIIFFNLSKCPYSDLTHTKTIGDVRQANVQFINNTRERKKKKKKKKKKKNEVNPVQRSVP